MVPCVQVVVAGQTSNALTVSVAAPEVDFVDLFDPATLSPAAMAVDACFQLQTDPAVDSVVQIQGKNFGASLAAVSVLLAANTSSGTCTPCFLTHTRARCVTSVSRGAVYNLTVVVAGQTSNVKPYSYAAIVDTTPPVLLTAAVHPAASPAMLSTVGGDVLTITGTKLGTLCGFNRLALGTTALPSMTFCNATVIMATIPPGSGVLGSLSLTVGTLEASVGGGAAMTFAYVAGRCAVGGCVCVFYCNPNPLPHGPHLFVC